MFFQESRLEFGIGHWNKGKIRVNDKENNKGFKIILFLETTISQMIGNRIEKKKESKRQGFTFLMVITVQILIKHIQYEKYGCKSVLRMMIQIFIKVQVFSSH